MRKLLLVAIFIGISISPVLAATTERGVYSVPNYPCAEKFLNETNEISHTHEYTDKDTIKKDRNKVGAGLDLVVYEDKTSVLESVEVQGRFDMISKTSSTYVVTKVNLFKLFKKKFVK